VQQIFDRRLLAQMAPPALLAPNLRARFFMVLGARKA